MNGDKVLNVKLLICYVAGLAEYFFYNTMLDVLSKK